MWFLKSYFQNINWPKNFPFLTDRFDDRFGDLFGDQFGDSFGARFGDRFGDRFSDRFGDRFDFFTCIGYKQLKIHI